jgi:uncharacterized protein YndB with AHSA1/START domain
MTTTKTNETTVEADPDVPTIRIVRDFDASRDRVYRAWVDPDLVSRWLGPRDVEIRIDHWDARTGGNWRYLVTRDGEELAAFYGSFHEVRPDARLVTTETFETFPDGVALNTITFEDVGDGRTRVDQLTVVDTFEGRDAIIASGMEQGVVTGYEKLDAILAAD